VNLNLGLSVLSFFRTNQVFLSILLILYILLLRFSTFLDHPFQWTPSGQGIFAENVHIWIGTQSIGAQVLAIFLLLVQGFLVNLLSINHRLINEVNLFPGVFYILVSCLIPDMLYLSPVLIGNTFIIIALIELFSTYKNPSCADKIFNAGFWTGIASLFYSPFVFYLILLMAALNILRAFKIEERLMALIGLFTPYILVGLYFFWNDQFGLFWDKQISTNLSFFSFSSGHKGWASSLNTFIFAVMLVYTIANNGQYFSKKNIQVQKKVSILYWVLISAGIASIFQNSLTFEHFLTFAPAMGIFLAMSFSSMKNQWAESVHFLLILAALALQFTPWLL